ncbi:MAG: hypothetical protein JXJ04_23875, partial [Spirochaetales bacterium]|nr:hypothetical protein [Spirochaetales bacterium]
MEFSIPKQTFNGATISAHGNRVVIEGDIDQDNPALYLQSFFNTVISHLHDLFILDITNLEYINSAGIKCIIGFLKEREPGSKVVIKSDKKKTWQRHSINILKSLDEKNISID